MKMHSPSFLVRPNVGILKKLSIRYFSNLKYFSSRPRLSNSSNNIGGILSCKLHRSSSRPIHLNQSVNPTSSLPQVQQRDEKHENDFIKQDILKDALNHPDFFSISDLFTVEDLFKANVHLGHREGSLNAYMKPYVFGSRLSHLVIDLDQTAPLLRTALNFAAHIAFRDGIILFVYRGVQHQILVETTAVKCKEFSHTRPWFEGILTNSDNHLGAEARLPELLIFLSTMNDAINQHPAVHEATKRLIPSIGIVDTNSDPRLITYPVPGNDDTFRAIELYCNLFTKAILKGKEKRLQLGILS